MESAGSGAAQVASEGGKTVVAGKSLQGEQYGCLRPLGEVPEELGIFDEAVEVHHVGRRGGLVCGNRLQGCESRIGQRWCRVLGH